MQFVKVNYESERVTKKQEMTSFSSYFCHDTPPHLQPVRFLHIHYRRRKKKTDVCWEVSSKTLCKVWVKGKTLITWKFLGYWCALTLPYSTGVAQRLLLMMIQMVPRTGSMYANAHSRMMRVLALAAGSDHTSTEIFIFPLWLESQHSIKEEMSEVENSHLLYASTDKWFLLL